MERINGKWVYSEDEKKQIKKTMAEYAALAQKYASIERMAEEFEYLSHWQSMDIKYQDICITMYGETVRPAVGVKINGVYDFIYAEFNTVEEMLENFEIKGKKLIDVLKEAWKPVSRD